MIDLARYSRLMELYARIIYPYSPAAADCLKEIEAQQGVQAAFAVGRLLMAVRLEAERTGNLTFPSEPELVDELPDTVLVEQAFAAFRTDWLKRKVMETNPPA